MINIYVTDLTKFIVSDKKNIGRFISDERQKRADILSNLEAKNNFIKAEIFTAQILHEVYKIDDPKLSGKQGEKTKVYGHPKISLNRSYAKSLLGLAVDTEHEIGIDCQCIEEFDKNTLKYFFTEHEITYINQSTNPNVAYYLLWTRKESIIKCSGRGLIENLKLLDTVPSENVKEQHYHCENYNSNKLQVDWLKEMTSKEQVSPIFSSNDNVNGYFINSYIYKDVIISVCINGDIVLPDIQIK